MVRNGRQIGGEINTDERNKTENIEIDPHKYSQLSID
jgi:hypothetical protein